MNRPFLGPEALAAGATTRGRLRWNYEAIFPRVYAAKGRVLTLLNRIEAAWLWSDRQGVITGQAAAFMHGVSWVDTDVGIEMIGLRRRACLGIVLRQERIGADEVVRIGGVLVASPARTAFDLARHHPRDEAVKLLDAVARATGVTAVEVEALARRYPGARGTRQARVAVSLMDPGSQSPKETWLRLLLIDAGLPAPRTQIEVTDGVATAFLDMGWDDPKIGLDYEGDQHRSERRRYVHDISRYDMVRRVGWLDIRVVAEHSRAFILHRVRAAWSERGFAP